MSIEEYNKRKKFVDKQEKKKVKAFLLPKIKENAFWFFVKQMNDG